MNETLLTPFQKRAERRLRSLLEAHGRTFDSRQILAGTVPFYSAEEQVVLKVSSKDLEVWILDNEASFSATERRGGFERADFDSEEDLLVTLLHEVEKLLEPHQS